MSIWDEGEWGGGGAVGQDEQTHTERTLEHVPGGQKTFLESQFSPYIFLCVSGTKIRSSGFGGQWSLPTEPSCSPPHTHTLKVLWQKSTASALETVEIG